VLFGDTSAFFQDDYSYKLPSLCYVATITMTSTRQKAWETKVSNAICDVPLTYILCLLQMSTPPGSHMKLRH